MAAGVLYIYPENFRGYKALIAAQYSGADLKVAPDFVFGESNKSEEFLKKFPAGKVPAYESADGKVLLTESNAIAYYVANAALRGSDVASQAAIYQWASCADSALIPASCAWVFPYLGIKQFNKQNVERAKSDLLAALKVLDGHLLTRTFLATERVTLADIIVFSTLIHAFQNVLEPTLMSGQVKKEPEPADFEEKLKETKNPFDSLPKDTFNTDDFKRSYSNEDDAVSIPYFWQKFDPENYSTWYAEYKYAEELSKVFMSCNLITGMFQCLDKMRKQAFASVCLFGADDDSSISGVWVWRRQQLAFALSPDWQIDYES